MRQEGALGFGFRFRFLWTSYCLRLPLLPHRIAHSRGFSNGFVTPVLYLLMGLAIHFERSWSGDMWSSLSEGSSLWVTMGGRWIVLPQKDNELVVEERESLKDK